MADRIIAEVFPPGEFIREEIEAREWSQGDLAEILGRPARLVNELIAGKRARHWRSRPACRAAFRSMRPTAAAAAQRLRSANRTARDLPRRAGSPCGSSN